MPRDSLHKFSSIISISQNLDQRVVIQKSRRMMTREYRLKSTTKNQTTRYPRKPHSMKFRDEIKITLRSFHSQLRWSCSSTFSLRPSHRENLTNRTFINHILMLSNTQSNEEYEQILDKRNFSFLVLLMKFPDE